MATIVRFANTPPLPMITFGKGKARELINYSGAGKLRLSSRSEIPEVAFLESSHKTLPEFICINAKMAVSPDVRAFVEELEPGRHQFFDVEIRRERGSKPILNKDGQPLQRPYYLLNPGARLDAVWIEKSDVDVNQFGSQPALVHEKPGRQDQVVLRRSVIEGHHVWKGQYHLGRSTFFSDTLVQAVLDRKWKGLRFIHLREE